MACKGNCDHERAAAKKVMDALLAYRERIYKKLERERPGEVKTLRDFKTRNSGSLFNIVATYFDFATWLYRFDDKNTRGWTVNINSYLYQREKHLDDISAIFAQHRGTATGRALRERFEKTKNELLILPYFNFKLYPVPPWRPLGLNATAHGTQKSGFGGSDSVIMFSANMWGRNGKPGTSGISSPGFEADEVLFHELVHSLRHMAGVSAAANKLGDGYQNEEEFIAVILSNIYLAEKGRKSLRGGHDGATMQQPENFLKNERYKQLLLKFKGEQRAFFDELSNIPKEKAWWNPLRELRDPPKPQA